MVHKNDPKKKVLNKFFKIRLFKAVCSMTRVKLILCKKTKLSEKKIQLEKNFFPKKKIANPNSMKNIRKKEPRSINDLFPEGEANSTFLQKKKEF